jgi:hypothetical protein
VMLLLRVLFSCLPLNINTHIASQTLVRFFTLEIFFTGINVSLIIVFKIIPGFILSHFVTAIKLYIIENSRITYNISEFKNAKIDAEKLEKSVISEKALSDFLF